jgi:hypothetical protein
VVLGNDLQTDNGMEAVVPGRVGFANKGIVQGNEQVNIQVVHTCSLEQSLFAE